MVIENLVYPTVNTNGTSWQELQQQLKAAWMSLFDSIKALQAMTPHGRDYQTQEPNQFSVAREQHVSRIRSLENIQDEVYSIYEKVCEHGNRIETSHHNLRN